MKYAVIVEPAGNNFSAYAPDLPGCIATGKTSEEAFQEMQSAIEFHLEGLRADGTPIPPPATHCNYIDVAVPSS